MKDRIVLHKSDEGFAVSVPGLPGCWSQGATEQEAMDNVRDAIREYLAVVDLEAKGQDVRT
ncbi:MAG: type II toxin-antitoxin system HicB family antitoxin [Nitrococcus sp.]|nr:type II toxin-antitoxin system HicB family antitoxin [Nitrococcus sp.]